MVRSSRSQRRARHIIERSGDARVRRGSSDRLEIGGDGLFERTDGARRLKVGGTLSEAVGGDHATRAKRVEQTVRGRTRIDGRTDTTLLGGAMTDVHAGAELVLAGMSDDLVIGAGARVTALLDVWLVGVVGLEDKLATATFDGALVDTARTLFEREYATGVHNAGCASFSGAVYATQATGFRKLMRVSSGVRNLSSGGGGGSGGGESPSPGSTPAATTPDAAADPGLLGSTRTPRPASAGSDSADLGRLADEARATEDASLYRRTEDVSGTTADLQEAARAQAASDNPDDAALGPSRLQSAQGSPIGATPPASANASPPSIHASPTTPDQGTASGAQPAWAPSSTRQRTYTNGQFRIGETPDEFRFNLVVGSRPDKLLSDDVQASADPAAFRIVYDVRNDVTDLAHNTARLADPDLAPKAVSDMTAVEARDYVTALHNGAVQAGDTEEARRLQDLLNELDNYAFDHYTAGLAQAESAYEVAPARLASSVKADALQQHLSALGEEQMTRALNSSLSDAEQAEATKLSAIYMLAAKDTAQGLDPVAQIQAVLDSRLDRADEVLYRRVAATIADFRVPAAVGAVAPPAKRSLWARAGEIASSLLSLIRIDSRPGSSLSHTNDASSADTPIRFLDDSTDLSRPDSARSLDAPLPHAGPAPGRTSRADGPPAGHSVPVDSVVLHRAPDMVLDAPADVHPSLDRDGAHWSLPTSSREDSAPPPWSDWSD